MKALARIITLSILWILILPLLIMKVSAQNSTTVLNINYDNIIHKMQGGIGASWHAISAEFPLENHLYNFPVREECPRGSAYGGNPPTKNQKAWKQITEHAGWLGLNFIRVELSQRMYEPEKKRFDWENEEMQALYNILDWCEENDADVFLQQMWAAVKWNSIDGVHPLISAPKSVDDFTNGIVTLLKHLTETKGYTCIKYFCMVNEPPGGTWGYWWEAGDQDGRTTGEVWKHLSATFKKNNIDIQISGPDWTNLPPFDASKLEFEHCFGSLDIHSYNGIYNKGEAIIKDWVAFAASKNKPFFVTEIGNMDLGWGTDNPGPKTFAAALSNASDVVTCMNLGVDAFNRWSFTNRGDLDGQWQLIKTYDRDKNIYLDKIVPEPEAYYGFAMLTRFMGKYATVVESSLTDNPNKLLAVAYKNTDGSAAIILVNNSEKEETIDINFERTEKSQPYYLYQVSEKILADTKFKLNPISKILAEKTIENIQVPAKSITVLTTSNLKNKNQGLVK